LLIRGKIRERERNPLKVGEKKYEQKLHALRLYIYITRIVSYFMDTEKNMIEILFGIGVVEF
jgi:hypothetical protein